MKILNYIQGEGKHSIDVLLAIYAITVERLQKQELQDIVISWKDIKEQVKSTGRTLSDGTYRDRRDELVDLGILEKVRTDPLKHNVKMTQRGLQIGEALQKFIDTMKEFDTPENTE